jgi:phospholipase C
MFIKNILKPKEPMIILYKTTNRIVDITGIKLPTRPTHIMCNQQAQVIMKNDGLLTQSKLIQSYQAELDAGVVWPDRGIQSIHHFYNALTGRGFPGGKPAMHFFLYYLHHARRIWMTGDYPSAMFYLGAATHYLQDLCEPHHSTCYLLRRHNYYEHWVERHLDKFTIDSAGIYQDWDPVQWLLQSANFSKDWLPAVSGDRTSYNEVSRNLLAYTQRITAGFWNFFLRGVDFNEAGFVV